MRLPIFLIRLNRLLFSIVCLCRMRTLCLELTEFTATVNSINKFEIKAHKIKWHILNANNPKLAQPNAVHTTRLSNPHWHSAPTAAHGTYTIPYANAATTADSRPSPRKRQSANGGQVFQAVRHSLTTQPPATAMATHDALYIGKQYVMARAITLPQHRQDTRRADAVEA